jgi:hypothetical protein
LSQHRSRLRRNIHEIPELQRDFNIYGEENFDFSPLWMDKDSSRENRIALEIEWISRFHTLCYNKFAKPDRKGPNNPFFGRSHRSESIEQISRSRREYQQNALSQGFPINLKGVIYSSISEASRQTNHSRDTLRRWLDDPTNLNCVAVDPTQPRFSQDFLQESTFAKENQSIGKKKISLYGEIYESISEAAKKRNCSRVIIQRLLRNHPENCFVVSDFSEKNESSKG